MTDADEIILQALREKPRSPKGLLKRCKELGVEERTYYRQLKKLKRLQRIKEAKYEIIELIEEADSKVVNNHLQILKKENDLAVILSRLERLSKLSQSKRIVTLPNVLGYLEELLKQYENYNSLKLNDSANRIYIKLQHFGDGKVKDHLGNIICYKKERDKMGTPKILMPRSGCTHYHDLYSDRLVFFQEVYSTFHKTGKHYHIDKDGYLCGFLKDINGKWKFSRIKYERYRCYENVNGEFKAGKLKEPTK